MTGEFIGRINIESALKYPGNILIFNDSNEGLNISSISLDSGNNWLAQVYPPLLSHRVDLYQLDIFNIGWNEYRYLH